MTNAQLNLFDVADEPQAPAAETAGFVLRPYQSEAVDAIERSLSEHRSTILLAATGSGKTVMLSHAIKRLSQTRCMWLVHRDELVRQAAATIGNVLGIDPAIEKAASWSDERNERCPVVVGSIQTQMSGRNRRRMERFNPAQFDLLIIDEAHRAACVSYRAAIDWYGQNSNTRVIGCTATGDRADKKSLGAVFESVAYEYPLQDAVSDGWLVKPLQSFVEVAELDLSTVRTVAGDLHQGQLQEKLVQEETAHKIVLGTLERVGDRQTIVFTVGVDQAELCADIFNRHRAGCARFVCAKTPEDERRRTLRDYAAGRVQFLCNVGVLTEGYDDPGTQVIAMARPTKSRMLYAQCVGRATRTFPKGLVDGIDEPDGRLAAIAGSVKPHAEVLDFVGNSGRHKLVSTVDIFAGSYDEPVVERARKIATEQSARGEPVDAEQALADAEHQLKHEEEERKRKVVVKRGRFVYRSVDPFDCLDIVRPRNDWGRNDQPISEQRMKQLERWYAKDGKWLINPAKLTHQEAGKLIGEALRRIKGGECTFRQARVLKKYGYDTAGMSMESASSLLDRLAKNNWKPLRDS